MDYGYWDQLVKNIEEYIQDESSDAQYYNILAGQAPTPLAKQILMEFSNDEAQHAANFKQAYACLTGRPYQEKPMAGPAAPAYTEALKRRILAETADYEKYGRQYLMAPDPYLRDLFFMTRTGEAKHAMRMPILLYESD